LLHNNPFVATFAITFPRKPITGTWSQATTTFVTRKQSVPRYLHPLREEVFTNMDILRLADLPQMCDRGTKKNAKGYKESWTGYKLHVDVNDTGFSL